MDQNSFQQACELYFKRGQKNWNSFFDKWESMAQNEDPSCSTEKIHDSDSDDSDDLVTDKKRRRMGYGPKSKKKKKKIINEVDDSDSEAIESEENVLTVQFSGNDPAIFNYLSDLSKKFADMTPFCSRNDFRFGPPAASMAQRCITDGSPSTSTSVYHFGINDYDPCPIEIGSPSVIRAGNSNLTHLPFRGRLYLPLVMSPTPRSTPRLTVLDSDDSDCNEEVISPQKAKKAEEQAAILRNKIMDAGSKNDIIDDSEDIIDLS